MQDTESKAELVRGVDCGLGDAKEILYVDSGDIGSTNSRRWRGHVDPGSDILVTDESVWLPHKQSSIKLNGHEIRAWNEETIQANMKPFQMKERGRITVRAMTGLGSTSMVADIEGVPILGFYDKPTLVHNNTPQTWETLERAGIPRDADQSYMWSKLSRFAEDSVEILEFLHRPDINRKDVIIETLLTLAARTIAGLPVGELGIDGDEWKGITNNSNGVTIGAVRKVFDVMGYGVEQYTLPPSREHKHPDVYVSGDLTTLFAYMQGLLQAGILPSDGSYVEMDSNFKYYKLADGKDSVFDRYYELFNLAYGLIRNGASANQRILSKYIFPDNAESMDWFLMADQAAGKAMETLENPAKTKFMYFPHTKNESIGIILNERGKPVPFEALSTLSLEDKQACVTTVYAGIAAELAYRINSGNMYIHGGFVKFPEQINKRNIVASIAAAAGISTYWLDLPDSSEMVGAKAAALKLGRPIISEKPLGIMKLDQPLKVDAFYNNWRSLREMAAGL